MYTLISLKKLTRFYNNLKSVIHEGYYNKNEIDSLIAEAVSKVYRYKGNKQTYSDLLLVTNPSIGDVYNVIEEDITHGVAAGDNFAWNGTSWDNLRGIINLTNYYTKEQIDNLIDEAVETSESYTDYLVAQEREKAAEDLEEATELLNAAIEGAKTRLTAAEGLLSDARTRLSTAEGNIGTLTTWKNTASAQLGVFAEYINTNDARVTSVEASIDAAEASIELHATAIDTLNDAVEEVGVDISAINSTLSLYANYLNPSTGELKDAIIKVNGQQASIQNYCAKILGNEASIGTLTTNYNSIVGRVATVESTASGLTTRVGTLELTSTSFGTRLTNTEGQVSSISQSVNSISTIVSNGSNYAAIVARINADNTSKIVLKADQIEAIGELITDTIEATNVTAENLKVKAANIEGTISATIIKSTDWQGGASGSGSFYIGGNDAIFNTGHFGKLYVNGNQLVIGQQSTTGANTYFDAQGILHCKGAQIEGMTVSENFEVSGVYTHGTVTENYDITLNSTNWGNITKDMETTSLVAPYLDHAQAVWTVQNANHNLRYIVKCNKSDVDYQSRRDDCLYIEFNNNTNKWGIYIGSTAIIDNT